MPIILAALLFLSQPVAPAGLGRSLPDDPKKGTTEDPKKDPAKDTKQGKEEETKKEKEKGKDAKKDSGKGSKTGARGKEAAKGKEATKEEARKPEAPIWKRTDSPYGNFLAATRQMPDFTRFPSGTESISVTVAVNEEKGLVFLDSVQARKAKGGFKVTGGNAVPVGDKDLVSKLVLGGADRSPDPESTGRFNGLLSIVRKARKVEGLSAAFLEAASANKKGYRINDDVAADMKACGDKRYFAALSTVPEVTYLGPDTVVVELEYTVQDASRSFKVRLSAARLQEGWKVGGLRVTCY